MFYSLHNTLWHQQLGRKGGKNRGCIGLKPGHNLYHKPNESQLVAVRGTLKTSKSLTSTSLPSSFAFLQEKSRLNFSSEDKNIYMYFVLSLYNVKTVMYKTKDDAH